MDISKIKQDSAAIDAGQWIDNIPDWPGARFRVRGMDSATAINLRDAKIRSLPDDDSDDDGNVKQAIIKRVTREVLAEAVLLEWDGLTNDGAPFPYDKAIADQMLTDPDFVKFQDAVAWAAKKVSKLNTGKREASAKNSVKPSSGD